MPVLATFDERVFTSTLPCDSERLLSNAALLCNGTPHPVLCKWDTGSSHTNISKKVVTELQMQTNGLFTAYTPQGVMNYPRHTFDLFLPNGVLVKDIVGAETRIDLQGIDILVGMDIISLGSFFVSHTQNGLFFSFITPPCEEFVSLFTSRDRHKR